MSRIGRTPVEIPAKVKVAVQGRTVSVEGPQGKLAWNLPAGITAAVADNKVVLKAEAADRETKALHGLSRSLVNNMVKGVATGYRKDLEIQGVGFKAALQGQNLTMSLGYSHPVIFPIPKTIKVTVADNTKISVEGPDKQLVGEVAARIRRFYPPEPYKGKGVRYVGEQVRRKEGKKVA
jgi:large subunit ribosomal protein L6